MNCLQIIVRDVLVVALITMLMMFISGDVKAASHQAAHCIANAVYHEARGESKLGQIAVANVIVNRSKKSKQSVCKVINKRGQFSYNHKARTSDLKSYRKALNAAFIALNGNDNTNGALYFNTASMGLRAGSYGAVRIGRHVFFKIKSKV